MKGKNIFLVILGALSAFFVATLCCVGPLILGGLGLGGLMASSTFVAYRPIFLIIAFLLLGYAWYRAFRPCGECSHNKTKVVKVILFVITLSLAVWLVVLFRAKPKEVSNTEFDESGNTLTALAYDKNTAGCPLCFMNGNYLISDEK